MKIEFFIACKPTAKGRPRFSINGHAYTPEKTRDAEKMIRAQAKAAMLIAGAEIIKDVPIAVRTDFYYAPLKSWSKKKLIAIDGAGYFWKTTKPDVDNLKKLVLDAMNGVVYADDALIAKSVETKRFWPRGEGVLVTVWTLEKEDEE